MSWILHGGGRYKVWQNKEGWHFEARKGNSVKKECRGTEGQAHRAAKFWINYGG